jgi:hypothetical protein
MPAVFLGHGNPLNQVLVDTKTLTDMYKKAFLATPPPAGPVWWSWY